MERAHRRVQDRAAMGRKFLLESTVTHSKSVSENKLSFGRDAELAVVHTVAWVASPGAARSTLFDVLDSHRSPGEALSQRSLHERVQIAIENVSGGARDLPCAKVFHHLIGLEYIRADLVTPANIGL